MSPTSLQVFKRDSILEVTDILLKGSIYKMQILRTGNTASLSSKKPQRATEGKVLTASACCFPASSDSQEASWGGKRAEDRRGQIPIQNSLLFQMNLYPEQ